MIPLTVSFFTKSSGSGKGVYQAVMYGFFIFLIYALLSVPFHFNTDPEVLNEIATSVWLNILFFVVFLVFAISFFGYFEITLPSNVINKTDSASRVGGLLGIFFMALTLALVSFSCTGPILGTVLGSSLKEGPWPITAAMSGFGVALGLPFALFAAFPGFMQKLPKSGSWLNSVKVVLGFIELALALKFLSNADLVLQWGLIKRETFFLIWALIGLGLGLYLMGVIRFPHDSPVPEKFSTGRKVLIGITFAFTIYLAPGVLERPFWHHNWLSGFPPPEFYSWYDKETFHAEFTDFEPALAEAKSRNKPLLIDFTGWACVNCRKMEESVWTVDAVKQKLENDFVLVSLYVDDKVKLPDSLQGVFRQEIDGEIVEKKIRTIGNKWSTFQTYVFNNNSQPYYVMLTPEGRLLGNPVGYTPNEREYLDWLNCGLQAFANKNLTQAQK
jgi:thiol:disulfide interchange protein DsbD